MSKQAKKERAAFRNMARTADHYGVDVSTIERWIDERGFPRPSAPDASASSKSPKPTHGMKRSASAPHDLARPLQSPRGVRLVSDDEGGRA